MKPQRWWKSFVVAALMSTLASLVIVAVGPGFSAPPDQANNESAAKGADKGKPDGSGGPNATDHDGDADRDPNTAYTEDNDTNDGNTPNNVVDDGDNAHPSGKDRSVEHGNSGNQGKAESDPDDDGRGPDRTNGGPDKPNGSGGVDKADQDGNNGCGNDDDFEDDNEGLCGGKTNNPPCRRNCGPPPGCQTNCGPPPGCQVNCDPVCPPGTDKAGQKAPGGDLTKCDNGHNPITLCHKTGNGYIILTTPDDSSLQGHLGHGDIYPVPAGGCPTPPPPCTVNCNPPPTCPPGSNLAGQPVPGGNVNNCYTSTPPPVCPPGSNLAGQPVPGGNVNNCYTGTPPPPLCPADSDRPGEPLPGGNILNCYNSNPPPEAFCPAGTDLAGLPIPQGDPALCDDDVLGGIITDGDIDGDAQERPATQGGRILPFTGSSILGFVLVGAQLLLAGGLFLRGRKRSAR